MAPGNHKYVEKLAMSLRKKGCSVDLIPPFHYATPFNFLKTMLLRNEYDVIHIQWIHIFPFGWLMKLFVSLAKKLGYKIIFTVHDIHEAALSAYLSNREKMRWMYNNADYRFIHYRSNLNALEIQLGVTPTDIEVVYHPVFEDSYPNTCTRTEARRWLGISEDKKVVLLFGKLAKYKGVEVFADAVEELDENYLGLLVGKEWDTGLLNRIKARGIPNLEIIGKFVTEEEVQYYFNACDVVVAPYLTISTSGVVLLAYAFAKPVITTHVGGMPEVVWHEQTGLLVPPDDVTALVNNIKKIFTMDYKEMGRLAYERAQEKFTWERLAEQTIKVYKRVLENENK